MKMNLRAALIAAVGVLVVSGPVLAHHGAALYEMGPDQMIHLKATITGYEYGSPHCIINFGTKDNKGNVRNWVLESPPPTMLIEAGPWKKETLKVGNVVTFYFQPCKDGKPCGLLRKVEFADGTQIAAYRQYVDGGTLQPPAAAQ